MFNSTLVQGAGGSSGGWSKVLRAEKRVCLHPEAAGHPSHSNRSSVHLSLSVLGRTKLIEPRGGGAGRGHLVEGDFGLAGFKKTVQR